MLQFNIEREARSSVPQDRSCPVAPAALPFLIVFQIIRWMSAANVSSYFSGSHGTCRACIFSFCPRHAALTGNACATLSPNLAPTEAGWTYNQIVTRLGHEGSYIAEMAHDVSPSADLIKVRFAVSSPFSRELKRRTDAYFAGPEGRGRRRDLPLMYLKTFVILTWLIASWALLVFAATEAWQGVLLAVSLGLSIAGVGMSIQHDANHGAYSSRPGVNWAFGLTLDAMGVSSSIWRQKHNVRHHTFTNIEGLDDDLDFGGIARLSPEQPRRPWHRYQHIYMWFLYGFLLPKWVFFDDWAVLLTRRMGAYRMPPLRGAALARFFAGKLFFIGWALVVPALFHPLWQVLVFHLIAVFTLGVTLSSVFQLAHCVEEADFPRASSAGEATATDSASHQLGTTVDFARKSAVLTWFLGGLNYQVEHHLFPKVCHLHYPALSRIVEEVAAQSGLRYRANRSLAGAIASHFRLLARLGSPSAPALIPG